MALSFNNDSTCDSEFRKNIRFNHLSIVIDDSTYNYLFDSLNFLKSFAKTKEQTTDAGSASWTGKYLFGINNYIEIFKAGGAQGVKLGDLGLGFITNKYLTIDSIHNFWSKTLDSVHEEKTTTSDDGTISPWFTSVSIPKVDSLKISAWVFENSKEEMKYAGFSDDDLLREIDFSEYNKHITAKLRNVSLDSVKYDKLFDKITSLQISLSGTELVYLKKFLTDIGFTEKDNSFVKKDFTIVYSLNNSQHFLLKNIHFLLLKKMTKEKYSYKKIDMIVDGNEATMILKYK